MTVIELIDKVTSAVERNESTLGIFLDLGSKAFDTINHDIFLYKLQYYGLIGLEVISKTENKISIM